MKRCLLFSLVAVPALAQPKAAHDLLNEPAKPLTLQQAKQLQHNSEALYQQEQQQLKQQKP